MKIVLDDSTSTLYWCDGGAIRCGVHAGVTARYTGHDVSGKKVVRVTPRDRVNAKRLYDLDLACKTCEEIEKRRAAQTAARKFIAIATCGVRLPGEPDEV